MHFPVVYESFIAEVTKAESVRVASLWSWHHLRERI